MIELGDVQPTLESLSGRLDAYAKYARYYDGDQSTAFASDIYRDTFGRLIRSLHYNRCSTVVDATADRLQIEAWQDEGAAPDAPSNKAAEELWNVAGGDELQGFVHVEAIKEGDAYVIVWPHPDDPQRPVWRMQSASTCEMIYDSETAEPIAGVKIWRETMGPDKGYWRLTIYEADAITRYISTSTNQTRMPAKPGTFRPYSGDGGSVVSNPYGTLPIFAFRNNPQHQGSCGRSDLSDVIALQDALNYTLWSLMIAEEFSAYPQKYATGVMPMDNESGASGRFAGGIDRWITVRAAEASFGVLQGGPLDPFIAACNDLDSKISRVTRIPVHWLGLAGVSDNVSGETLKMLEGPFVSKLNDRAVSYGKAWGDAMGLALSIAGAVQENERRVMPIWKSFEAKSEADKLMGAMSKQTLGIPQRQIWKELGYTDDQIVAMLAESERVANEQAERNARLFSQGGATGFQEEDEQTSDEADA